MRKFIVAILAVLYIGTASGATVHVHYCMGKLLDWNLWHKGQDKCSNCGMKKSPLKDNGCCKDEHKHIKTVNDQKVVESDFSLSKPVFQLSYHTYNGFFENTASIVLYEFPLVHSPPLNGLTQLFIQNRVFRI